MPRGDIYITLKKVNFKTKMSYKPRHRNVWINYLKILITVFLITRFIPFSYSQEFKLTLQIKNQLQNQIIIGTLKGDKFTPADTLEVQLVTSDSPAEFSINTNNHTFKTTTFTFTETCKPGMYRLVLGQTSYTKVMNEPPRQIEFIFNNENIVFETDFKAPVDSLKIAESEENRVWFGFLQKEKEYQKQLKEVEAEMDFYRTSAKSFETAKRIETYNQLQHERDNLIQRTVEKNHELFAARLIKMYREAFLDGNLPKEERTRILKDNYFKNLDFTDESLINSSGYTENVLNT
jgi:hypothetical protein